jgi:hypothetical protein
MGNLRVRAEERRQHGIRRQIVVVGQQRGVVPQHVGERRRVLAHQRLELLARLLGVERADGRRLHGLRLGRLSGRLRARPGGRRGFAWLGRSGLRRAGTGFQHGRHGQNRNEGEGGKTAAHVGGSRIKNCYLANTPGLPVG